MDKTAVKMTLEGSEWVLTFLKGEIELLDYLNKELSTFMECISVTRRLLPFLAVFKG